MTNSNYIESLGWKVPKGTFPCWVISESDRIDSLKQKKTFINFQPSCYFKVTKQLDNNFLQGNLGHHEYNGGFHDDIVSSYTYFSKYESRHPVYFSFDRVSLFRLITIYPTKPLTFMLKRIDSPKAIVQNKAFMIMPFKHKDLNILYQMHIKNFLFKELQIQIFRADDFNGNDIIIETIYNQIEESEFVIADISHDNKNVFYELGWAAAMDKEIITIQNQEVTDNIFFDRRHIRTRLYSLKNIPELQRQLKNDIISIREKTNSKF